MKLRNREIISKNEDESNYSQMYQQYISESIQKNIIDSMHEINIKNIENQNILNNKIILSINNISNSILERNNKTDMYIKEKNNIIKRNTFIIIFLSLCLSLTTSFISIEFSKEIIKFIISMPTLFMDNIINYSVGNFITYNNYFTNKIETFSLPTHIKNIEYISQFYITCILTYIYYTSLTIMRFITNISNGNLSLFLSPISIKCESKKNIETHQNTENTNIKNICNTIKEVYRLNNREKIIKNSICY